MKKLSVLLILIMCIALLASCGIKEQLEQMSDNIKGQIIDMAGQFIEKNTDTNSQDNSSDPIIDEKPTDTPSDVDTSSDILSEIVPDTPDVPVVPEPPVEPDYVVLEREKYPLNKYVGFNITKSNEKILDNEYKYNTVYGYGRFDTTLENMINAASYSHPITYLTISGIESNVALGLDLTKIKLEATEEEKSYAQLSAEIRQFANSFCKDNFLSNLKRMEIGTNPDLDMSAKDYALLLNTIYDDNCMQNGEEIGTTFISTDIRLITGKMSYLNLTYVKELMTEIQQGRNDEFLPISGWSFSISTNGLSPEKTFANNEELKELISYRNEHFENIEIYLSDFGWDTVNTESQNYIAPSNGYTSEELQSMYMLRAYLILYAMDVDKSSYSRILDTSDNGEGVIDVDGNKKTAYYSLEFFKSKMNGMYISEVVSNGENDIYCYKFTNENGKTTLALWSSNGSQSYTVENIPQSVTVSAYDTATKSYASNVAETDGTFVTALGESVMFIEY